MTHSLDISCLLKGKELNDITYVRCMGLKIHETEKFCLDLMQSETSCTSCCVPDGRCGFRSFVYNMEVISEEWSAKCNIY